MPLCLKSISLLFALLCLPIVARAQTFYPDSIGARVRYELTIDMSKAYVGGILIMARTGEQAFDASLVNEFGISLMDFSYDEQKGKVKILSILKKLDKWYIKRVLRSDLKEVLSIMQQGGNEYYDKKHKIKYTFTLINDTTQ